MRVSFICSLLQTDVCKLMFVVEARGTDGEGSEVIRTAAEREREASWK